MTTSTDSEHGPFHISWGLGMVLLSSIALFFLWEEHRAHLLGALPWLLFLACPLLHLFMHGGHGHGPGDGESARRAGDGTPKAMTEHAQHRGDGT